MEYDFCPLRRHRAINRDILESFEGEERAMVSVGSALISALQNTQNNPCCKELSGQNISCAKGERPRFYLIALGVIGLCLIGGKFLVGCYGLTFVPAKLLCQSEVLTQCQRMWLYLELGHLK
jgi:hypothetical protein